MATARQIQAAEKIVENLRSNRPKPIGEILKGIGYSKSVQEAPTNVTNSKGFIQLMEEAGVTDSKISQVMNEGLEATDREVINHYKYDKKTGKVTEKTMEIREYPNLAIRHKYLETAVKLKGHLKSDDSAPIGNTYNTFIQQNNLDPNTPEAKTLVDSTLDALMAQTKRKVIDGQKPLN